MPKRSSKRQRAQQENLNDEMSRFNISSNSEPIIQTGPLFDPGAHAGLVQIMNQLDPTSFINFASTCKYIYNICSNADGIQIPFGSIQFGRGPEELGCEVVVTNRVGVELYKIGGIREAAVDLWGDEEPRRLFSEKELQGLQKMPFILQIDSVKFEDYDETEPIKARPLRKLCQFLHGFHRVVINEIAPEFVEGWDVLVQIARDFDVKRMSIGHVSAALLDPIPVELLPVLLKKVDQFHCYYNVPDEMILSAESKVLSLHHARISTDTFKELLKKYAAGEFSCWLIGREPLVRDSDPFLDACSEVMNVVTVNDISGVTDSGVLYRNSSNLREFHLLIADGSHGVINIEPEFIQFTETGINSPRFVNFVPFFFNL